MAAFFDAEGKMTVNKAERKIIYNGNGTTTVFAVPFYFLNNGDLYAIVSDGTSQTILEQGVDYSISGAGNEQGGMIETFLPVAAGSKIAVVREVPYKQEMDIPENNIFPSQNMERALDRLTMQTQQLAEEASRSVKVGLFSEADPADLIDQIEVIYSNKENIDVVAGSIDSVNTAAENIDAIKMAPSQAAAAAASAAEASSSELAAAGSASAAAESAAAALSDADRAEGYANSIAQQGLQPCQIVSGFFSADWTPDGWHACDGTEFTRAQFPEIYDNYLTSTPSKAVVCTYDAYAAEISTYGQCAKFAVDAAAQKFKIPTIKDGAAVNQALSASEAGKAYNESLPNAGGGLLHFCGSEEAAGSGMVSVVEESAGFGGGIAARKVSAFFDLKRSNSTYQDGAKVQTDHVRLRHFVVLSNGQINQSMMDWAAYMGALDGKAGIDAVNFTADGKSRIINWEAPDLSNFVTNIFNAYVSSAAQTYTAPEAGWVCVLLDSTTPADSMVYLQTSNAYQDRVRGGGGVLRLFLGKGQTCALLTAGSATASAMISSFFPAKGINNV